ncbi:MAG: penicillin-binding protein 2 [Microscillaceae bacterium]|nr:penicillin-binding protein 2 [Microscillaceae bacterium]
MLENRKWTVLGIFFLTGLVFLVKLFIIQVVNEDYKLRAEDNSIKRRVIYPHRGTILDRKGRVLVVNAPVYDIMITPSQVDLKDTLGFCQLVGISPEEFAKKLAEVKHYRNKKVPFIKQISKVEYARIQDRLITYRGFSVDSRTVRLYPHTSLAHALGYIAEISPESLEGDTSGYYQLGDYVGKSGLEAAYEKELRGIKGAEYFWEDAHGNRKGKYKGGAFDSTKVDGQRLISTIDLELQQYGELLMKNKKGAIVAIEPSTGEVLAMISAPSYDPNILTGGDFPKNYNKLLRDDHKPLFNRTIQAKYPPGSTFKTVQALIAMQEHVVNDQTVFPCNKALVKCHWHPTTDLQRSIQHSCNPYYYQVFRRIVHQNVISQKDSITTVARDGDHRAGYSTWRDYITTFNLGRKTGIDLANELGGLIPDLNFFDTRYGKDNWKYSNIYSLSIGQGEIGVLPVQLANVAAIIANRGYYFTPHLVKAIGNRQAPKPEYLVKHHTKIDPKHFELIIQGMRGAYLSGTVSYTAIIQGLEVCGKTGTAQNPHGEDHSVFIAFAPMENPKIAMAVYVENAGFGGTWAAPIAALMIEKYLKGEISRKDTEAMVLQKEFIEEKTPVAVPLEELERLYRKEKPKKDTIDKPKNILAIGH